MRIRRTPAAVAVAIGLAVAVAPAALAKDGDVRARGTCTKNAISKLKLSDENGRIEVEFEVDQNRNGVPWKVTLRRNGSLVASTTATTRGPSGSFEVRRVISRSAGGSRVVGTAKSPSGETCTVRARF